MEMVSPVQNVMLSPLLLRTLVWCEAFPVAYVPVDLRAVTARWKLNVLASGLRSHPIPVPVPCSQFVAVHELGASQQLG